MSLTIGLDTTHTTGMVTGLFDQVRTREAAAPAASDSVSTTPQSAISEEQATDIMSALPEQRADALSAHKGLDLGRAMKLLEGLEDFQ